MMKIRSIALASSLAVAAMAPMGMMQRANAVTAEDLDRDGGQALQALIKLNPGAAAIAQKARAVLIFPNIVKAGAGVPARAMARAC